MTEYHLVIPYAEGLLLFVGSLGVFIVRGGATVILAMGDGRKAAANMHEYLQGKHS